MFRFARFKVRNDVHHVHTYNEAMNLVTLRVVIDELGGYNEDDSLCICFCIALCSWGMLLSMDR